MNLRKNIYLCSDNGHTGQEQRRDYAGAMPKGLSANIFTQEFSFNHYMQLKYSVPEGFLKEEVKDGYTVSSEMKHVWAVQLDLLKELLRVCDKYGLRIYADGGTLIGAMRHKGYIPWDDDIDMVMLRPDYDRLCEVADKEFTHPHFFQTIFSDDRYIHRHAQLRNSTTACWSAKGHGKHVHFNEGIFIDIFILDGMPGNPRGMNHLYEKHRRAKTKLKLVSSIMQRMPESVYRWCQKHVNCLSDHHLMKKYEDLLREIPCDKSYLLCKFSMRNNHFLKRAACYGEPKMVPFEFMQIPVPEGYDELLTVQFGDWRTPTQSPTYHGAMKYDTEHSYKELFH